MSTCGPFQPFGRAQNPDGTWTIGTNASCEIPCPNPYSHTYTFLFPSTIKYLNGDEFTFVGSAIARVEGHHDRVGRSGIRLVTVDSAALTDPAGNVLPLEKTEIGDLRLFPVDRWASTTPLQPDTLYSFAVSGRDLGINPTEDMLVIDAIYQAAQATGGGGNGDD